MTMRFPQTGRLVIATEDGRPRVAKDEEAAASSQDPPVDATAVNVPVARVTLIKQKAAGCGPLEPKFGAFASATLKCLALIEQSADRMYELTSKSNALQQMAISHAESIVPGSSFVGGPVDPRKRKNAIEAAKQRFIDEASANFARQIGEQFGDEAEKRGAAMAEATEGVKNAIDYWHAKALFAAGTDGGNTLEELIRGQNRRVAMNEKDPREVRQMRNDALAAGDEEMVDMIDFAAAPRMFELVQQGPTRLAKTKAVSRDTSLEGEKDEIFLAARLLLREIEQRRLEQLPDWLVAAAQLYEDHARPLFRQVVGLDPRVGKGMTSDQIMSYAARGGLGFSIDPLWLVRDLPPRGQWPAGWRPVTGKNQFGKFRAK
jgi:hypothetical protein